MRVRLDEFDVDVEIVGARKIILDGGAHIGAIIDLEDDSYVVGPLVHDRRDSYPLDLFGYAVGKNRGAVPVRDSMEDEQFEAFHRLLAAVAEALSLTVRRG